MIVNKNRSFRSLTGLCTMLCTFLTTICGVRASRTIHRGVLRSLMRVAVIFHETTTMGSVMNRVSDDMSTVDLIVPFTLRSLINSVLSALIALVIVSITSPWVLVSVIPLAILYFLTQVMYAH